MLPTESPENSFTNKLYIIITTIQLTSRDQNNLITMNGLPNVHKENFLFRLVLEAFSQRSFIQPCKISPFHSSLTRDQLRVKKSVSPNALLQTLLLKVPIHTAIFNITPLIMNTSLDKKQLNSIVLSYLLITQLFTNSTDHLPQSLSFPRLQCHYY